MGSCWNIRARLEAYPVSVPAQIGDDADLIKWGHIHRDIIVRFGRFPHRNACLGRETTAEEQAFLDGGGFGG